MSTDKVANLLHSIQKLTGIDEQVCRDAAMAVADFYHTQEVEDILEALYLYLADGQEERFMVHQFREHVRTKQANLQHVASLQSEMHNRAHQFTKALAALWLLLYKGERDKQAVKETLLLRIEEQRKFLDELEHEVKEL